MAGSEEEEAGEPASRKADQKRKWAPNSPENERGTMTPLGVINPTG